MIAFPGRHSLLQFFRSSRGVGAELKVLKADDDLRITSLGDPDAPGLFLCFTGIRQGMGGINAEEFVGSTALPGFSAIFVSDLKRSWFNGFAPEALTDVIASRIEGKRVVTLGNSMGGFGAIWATGILPVETAIAFAPQFSVHPEVVPQEDRWWDFRADIAEWRHRSLAESFFPDTRYYTINGSADTLHWSQFPTLTNCEHVLIEDSGHEPAAVVKRHGLLNDLIAAALHKESTLDLLQSKGVPCRSTTP